MTSAATTSARTRNSFGGGRQVVRVWSSHPLIPLTEEGERLRDALQDPDIQRLAWERHGFRSGDVGAENDPADIDFPGVPATIDAVIPMPAPAVMQQIIDALAD